MHDVVAIERIQVLDQSSWSGTNELWMAPEGNDAECSPATLSIAGREIHYTWVTDGELVTGRIELGYDQVFWIDPWHNPDGADLEYLDPLGAYFRAVYAYPAQEGADWHWRVGMAMRPNAVLILQMTSIPSWGEEQRAVRMTLTRDG